ncbi:methyltransferase domain-containing protein [Candidatus Woesearchaeota archaeon]|nr:methyltransferase domain-containing protein [Candidatus Woesearchaeota archaeon]
MEEVWDKHAEIWSEWNYSPDMIIEGNNIILDWMRSLPKKGLVLDEGCGVGQYTICLSKLGFKSVGIDFSTPLLKIAKKNRMKNRCDYELASGDITNLPFKSSTFTIVVSAGIIEHFKNTETAIQECGRVLKSGGALFIHVPQKIGVFTVNKLLQQLLGLWKEGYEKSFTPWKIKSLLIGAGFEVKSAKINPIGEGRIPMVGKILKTLDAPFRMVGLGGHHIHIYCIKK